MGIASAGTAAAYIAIEKTDVAMALSRETIFHASYLAFQEGVPDRNKSFV
jgi:hypothetical protein